MLRRITIGLSFAFLVSLPATAQDFQKGLTAAKSGDYATALRNFRPLAKQGERKAQFRLGQLHANGRGVPRDYAEAAKWYRRAANQNHAGAQDRLARLYRRGRGVPRDNVQAYKWFSLSASRWPASMRPQAPAIKKRNKISKKMTRAQIVEAQKLVREWRPSTRQAKRKIGPSGKKDFDFGFAASKRGDNDAAIRYFSRAIESGELSQRLLAFAHSNRAIAYSAKGLHDRAIKDSSRAIQLRAGYFWAYINRAIAYRASRRFQLALNDIETARRLKTSMPVFYHLGWTLHEMGHYDRAIEAINSGLRYQPDYASAFYRRGLSYEAKGDSQRALQDFKKAFSLRPDGPEIKNKMRELGLLRQAARSQGDYKRGQVAYHRGEFTAALREWSLLAEKGYARSQYSVGVLFDRGQGVPQNYAEAARWYKLAAEQGYAGAQYNLAHLFRRGLGVPRDFAKAAKWFRKAAEQGHTEAKEALRKFETKQQAKTRQATPSQANFEVGLAAFVRKDYVTALKVFKPLAEEAHATSQFYMGYLHYAGFGVPKDYSRALRWWFKSAQQGYPGAENSLGVAYSLGEGVKRDEVKAVEWWLKAAEKGLAEAETNLANMYLEGKGVRQNDSQAVYWYAKAAAQGCPMAQTNLANLYFRNRGGPSDVRERTIEAIKWIRLAARKNIRAATNMIKRLQKKPPPDASILPEADQRANRWQPTVHPDRDVPAWWEKGVITC